MSTVSGSHSIGSIAAEVLSPKLLSFEVCSPLSGNPSDALAHERIPNVQSVADSPDALATIAENRLSPQIEQQESQPSQEGERPHPRPSSPSDAILIKRTAVPLLKLDTGGYEINQAGFQQQL